MRLLVTVGVAIIISFLFVFQSSAATVSGYEYCYGDAYMSYSFPGISSITCQAPTSGSVSYPNSPCGSSWPHAAQLSSNGLSQLQIIQYIEYGGGSSYQTTPTVARIQHCDPCGGSSGNSYFLWDWIDEEWDDRGYLPAGSTPTITTVSFNAQATRYINKNGDEYGMAFSFHGGYPVLDCSAINYVKWELTLPVESVSFIAESLNEGILLTWKEPSLPTYFGWTLLKSAPFDESESQNDSFDLPIDSYQPVNDDVILPNLIEYYIFDESVEDGMTYFYMLEKMNLDGTSEFFGPISEKFSSSDSSESNEEDSGVEDDDDQAYSEDAIDSYDHDEYGCGGM